MILIEIRSASDRPKYFWQISVDGEDHGGGWSATEAGAAEDAMNYLKDIGRDRTR